jgi:hypothetical protein
VHRVVSNVGAELCFPIRPSERVTTPRNYPTTRRVAPMEKLIEVQRKDFIRSPRGSNHLNVAPQSQPIGRNRPPLGIAVDSQRARL